MTFSQEFIEKCVTVLNGIDAEALENAAKQLAAVRSAGGRLFIMGSGGGAGHASHATCDFRKLCAFEAYAPYDNVSELTARVNDDGWESTLTNWLKVSRLNKNDGLLIFSVGGGSSEKKVSMNLINAAKYGSELDATVIGITGKNGGEIATIAAVSIIIPDLHPQLVTPLVEGLQAVVWHLLVSHPLLQVNTAKWEGLANK